MFLFPVVTVQSAAAEEQCWMSSPAWVHLLGEPGSTCNCWRGAEKVLLQKQRGTYVKSQAESQSLLLWRKHSSAEEWSVEQWDQGNAVT